MHGDHVFGLPGMLHSLSFMGRSRELEIVGPEGIRQFVNSVNRAVRWYSQFPIQVREVSAGRIVNEEEYEVRAAWARHGVECLAYAFQEKPRPGRFDPVKARRLGIPEGPLWKNLQNGHVIRVRGRKIRPSLVVGPSRKGVKVTYAVDTRPCVSVVRLASDSDLLIHDGTFDESASTKAREYGHSTAVEAARVAKAGKVRRLALFHISAMYEDPRPLVRQACRIFPKTILSEDMSTIYVSR